MKKDFVSIRQWILKSVVSVSMGLVFASGAMASDVESFKNDSVAVDENINESNSDFVDGIIVMDHDRYPGRPYPRPPIRRHPGRPYPPPDYYPPGRPYPPPGRPYPPPDYNPPGRPYPPPPPPDYNPPGRPYPPPPNYGYGCGDQRVELLCQVRGDGISGNRYVTAYTNCSRYGNEPEGSYCFSVETPGFYQRDMRVEFQCQNGHWVWTLGSHGNCQLTRY